MKVCFFFPNCKSHCKLVRKENSNQITEGRPLEAGESPGAEGRVPMLLYVAAIDSPQQHERIAVKSVPTVTTPAYFQAKVTRLFDVCVTVHV